MQFRAITTHIPSIARGTNSLEAGSASIAPGEFLVHVHDLALRAGGDRRQL
jgi:hypothetical protein